MTDPITDMLNQIKNAKAVSKTEVILPFSNFKNKIALILAQEGFIKEVKKIIKEKQKSMKIILKYDNGVSAFEDAKRISKPGQRIYIKNNEIKKVKGGFGVAIISTSKGLMTGEQAKKLKLGGELICEVW